MPHRSIPADREPASVSVEIAAAFDRSEWTRQERIAFTLSTAAHAFDLYTSMQDNNCVESNPILGKNPSDAALVGIKLLAIGTEYILYNSPRIDNAHWFGYTSALISGYAGYSNTQNECYRND